MGQKPQINPWMHCVYTSDHFEPEPDSRDWVNWLERRLRWSRPRLHRSGQRVCSVALKRCPGKSSQRSTLIAQVAKVNWNIWSIVVRPVIIQALQRQQSSKKNNKKLPLHHQKSVEALVVMWTPSRHKWPTPSRKYHIKFLPLLCPTIKITCMIKKRSQQVSRQIKPLSVSVCSVKRRIRYENRRVSLQHFKLKRGLCNTAVRQKSC